MGTSFLKIKIKCHPSESFVFYFFDHKGDSDKKNMWMAIEPSRLISIDS